MQYTDLMARHTLVLRRHAHLFRARIARPVAVGVRSFGLALLMVFVLCACQPGPPTKDKIVGSETREIVRFDVNLKSYLDRPIFDVHLNGVDIGVAGGPPHTGNGGVMTGVAVPLGPQIVTWRLGGPEGMIGNGDFVKAENEPVLMRRDPRMRYLGVHIYPDNTVELIPEAHWPERTERGEAVNRAWERRHGQ